MRTLIFGVVGSNPPRYAIYDVTDEEAGIKRILAKNPQYVYLGTETIKHSSKQVSEFSTWFNRSMDQYSFLASKYPIPSMAEVEGEFRSNITFQYFDK